MSLRGTVLHSHGAGPQLKAAEVEFAAGPGEALVEMRLAAVASQDRSTLAGRQPSVPFVPGSEGAGVVVSSEVVEPGTTVIVRGEGVGVTRPGVWGQYAVVPDAAVHRRRASLDPGGGGSMVSDA